jgi:hypothetical protein
LYHHGFTGNALGQTNFLHVFLIGDTLRSP